MRHAALSTAAEAFCDALLRGYLTSLVLPFVKPYVPWIPRILSVEERSPSLRLWRPWRPQLRSDGYGSPAIGFDRAKLRRRPVHVVAGLLAVAAIAGGDHIAVRRGGLVAVRPSSGAPSVSTAGAEPDTAQGSGDPVVESEGGTTSSVTNALLVVCHDSALGTDAAREAERRIRTARSEGSLPIGIPVVAVLVGHLGPLPGEATCVRGQRIGDLLHANPTSNMPEDLVAEGGEEHLIDGARSGTIIMVDGRNLIEAAA